MGFNTDYATLRVNSKTIKYEKFGYEMPKKMSKGKLVYDTSKTINIHLNDLNPKSSVKLSYSCDNCGKNIDVEWRRYLVYNLDGKYYCRDCKHENPKLIKWLNKKEKQSNSRSSSEYNIFVRTVLKRDNFTCQYCGEKGSKSQLDIHHLNGYKWFVEGRTDPANGITLCNDTLNGCHNMFHSLYGKIRNTREQFEEWIGHELESLDHYEKILPAPQVYCIEDNKIYKDRFECAKELNCSDSYIYQVCHGDRRSYKGKHYVYLHNYLKMNQKDIDALIDYKRNIKYYKQVINPEFGELFIGIGKAADRYSIKFSSNISACCNKKRKHAGECNGTKLTWMWYEDYIKLSTIDKINFIEKHLETLNSESFLLQQYNELSILEKIA